MIAQVYLNDLANFFLYKKKKKILILLVCQVIEGAPLDLIPTLQGLFVLMLP